ncbi:hypothetical protein [Streptomyces sp. WMMB303]|uniref:hypothetical protein n=1 Tax=Streptomyces sp. WMMB303 TaxID=3034154 RepID=UPI0023ED5ED2|nr:hypothetical protein [Streptomyces sp. WMMB303]MDF4251215.1 hypothetical protein [Streptomyces sp. WMMB303]
MTVQVRAHVRGGAPVRAHTRSHPGSAGQLAVLGLIAILVWGATEGGIKVKGEMEPPPPHRPVSNGPAQPGGAR